MLNLHHDEIPLALQHHLHQRIWFYIDPKDIGQDDYVSPLDAEYRRQGRQQASVGTIPTAEVLSTTGLADRDRSETSVGNGDESVSTVWVIVDRSISPLLVCKSGTGERWVGSAMATDRMVKGVEGGAGNLAR